MELEPPQPTVPETAATRRQGRSYLATALIWFGVLLAITLVAWAVLWSGGLKEAAPADATPSSAERS
jgi:hypothetical protein